MLLGILKESAPGETRVALLPESLKSLLAQGSLVVESGAGLASGASDEAYAEAGATVTADRASILANADFCPSSTLPARSGPLKSGAVVIGFLSRSTRRKRSPPPSTSGHAVQHGTCAAHQPCAVHGRTFLHGYRRGL